MISNRSVPTNILLPHIVYQDVGKALDWLSATFGFIENYRYGESGGQVSGAQMRLGDAVIMLRTARAGAATPDRLAYGTQSLTIFVEDIDAHYQRAKSSGAKIVEELNETAYGEKQFGVHDLDGHHWLFSRHVRDVSPDEWGAKIAKIDG